jgi:signal peptidase
VIEHHTSLSRRLLGSAALVALAGLGALILVPALLGFERYVITGGSMGATIPRGSIAYAKVVPAGRIRVGDVITYRPPGAARHPLVTHRVVWAGRDARGARIYRTRGDANRVADRWTFRLAGPRQARVVFHVPGVGYVLAALSVRWVRVAVLGVPALAIAFAAFARGSSGRRREAPGAGLAGA